MAAVAQACWGQEEVDCISREQTYSRDAIFTKGD